MSRLISSTALALCFLAGQSFVYSQQTVDDNRSQQAQEPPANNTADPPAANEADPPSRPSEATPGQRNVPSNEGSQLTDPGNTDQSAGIFPDDNSPWFDTDELRRELDLDEDQIRRLNDAYGAAWRQMRAEGGNAGGVGEGLSEEARQRRTRDLRDRFDDTFSRDSSSIFRDEQQRQRFNQLSLQRQGLSAFDNPRLQRELNLNDTQLRQLRDLNNEWNTEMERLGGTFAGNRSASEQGFNQLRERSQTRLDGILNERQRTAFNEMRGDQFDFGVESFLGSQRSNSAGLGQGSDLGTPRSSAPQGTGLGTPQSAAPQGSDLGTPQGGAAGAGLGTSPSGSGSGSASGTGSGAGTSGSGSGTGGGGGTSGSSGGSGGGT